MAAGTGRIGLLSDAHGNPLGLRAALAALATAGAGETYFLGDAVGYLPGEGEVIRTLVEVGAHCLRGNHEGMLLGELPLDPVRDEAYRLGPVRDRLGAAERALLAGWPDQREVTLGGRRVLMVHGSPRDRLLEYVYPDSDLDWLADLGYDAIFMGNTHRPFVARRGEVLIVNVGSCGLPRDAGDLPAAAVYDPATHECEILRVRVSAEAVLAQFPDHPHPLVSECLHRHAATPVGSMVEQI